MHIVQCIIKILIGRVKQIHCCEKYVLLSGIQRACTGNHLKVAPTLNPQYHLNIASRLYHGLCSWAAIRGDLLRPAVFKLRIGGIRDPALNLTNSSLEHYRPP